MKRLATAAVAIPVALLLTQYSPNWLFALVAGLLAALMLDEYLQLSVATGHSRPGRWFLIPGALVAASFFYYPGGVVAALTLAAKPDGKAAATPNIARQSVSINTCDARARPREILIEKSVWFPLLLFISTSPGSFKKELLRERISFVLS